MQDLQIETTILLSNKDIYMSRQDDFLITSLRSSIKVDFSNELSCLDFSNGVIKLEEVGHISFYQLDLDFPQRNLAILADLISQDLCYAASFFLYGQGQRYLSDRYLFYVDEVFVQPKYRGLKYGIKALAISLSGFALGETVCCHPYPIHDLRNKYSDKQGKRLIKRYWSKIGLENYAEPQNILWAENWSMPEWLEERIFSE